MSELPTAEPAGRTTTEVVVSVPTVVKAVGIFFAILLAYLVRDALLSIALSAVMILGLDPPVRALERRGWGRGKAAPVRSWPCVAASVKIVLRELTEVRRDGRARQRGVGGQRSAGPAVIRPLRTAFSSAA